MRIFLFSIFIFIINQCVFSQEYNAELVFQQTNISVSKDQLITDYQYEIMINNRKGAKFSEVQIPFSKMIKLNRIKARLIDANGKTIKQLKKKDLSERSAISDISFYEDDLVKEFSLHHHEYPYTLVYSYQTRQSEFLYVDYWSPVLNFDLPTTKAVLNLTTPRDYQISYLNQFVDAPTIDTLKDQLIYHWRTSYTRQVKTEIWAPPLSMAVPMVMITPNRFHFKVPGSFKNWNSYGDWQQELLIGLDQLPPSEIRDIHLLTKGLKTDLEKIQRLYHYLQDETRYLNVTIETGGMQPYPASYVAENKYGDCKALTNYFMAILRQLDIEAYYTKVYAGNPIKKINTAFPSQQFNHVILYLPLLEDTIWLDCTSKGPFNQLGTFTQNRQSLIVDTGTSRFYKTPALLPYQVRQSRRIAVQYLGNQKAELTLSNQYRGRLFELLLAVDNDYKSTKKSELIRDYLLNMDLTIDQVSLNRPHRDSTFFDVQITGNTKAVFKKYGNELLVSPLPFSLPTLSDPGDRMLPLQIDYPVYQIDTIAIVIPKGYAIASLPDNQSLSENIGYYHLDYKTHTNEILIIKSILIRRESVSNADYTEYYNFIQQVHDFENKPHIVLKKLD